MLPGGENPANLPPSNLPPTARTISLSTLIELMLQRTYQELTIMAELLPRKTDMERKIEIFEFASRTRQMFVRLLALVKWANSVSKVEKCVRMSTFLDQQQALFIETADSLARMARETLVHARLPSFALPCAVDVLTTGTYPRLPFCIKEKIVPPDLITPTEKKQTLERLTQIIEYRIVSAELPAQMCSPKIGNGRVKFTVDHEFEVTLTLMGDDPNIPWRLLDIEILVEDPETGCGQSLVHSLQVNYIHQLVQSRLMENDKPLHELYDCLHSFCQSLQLEVLHSQAQVLIHQRGLGESLKIEKYEMGRRLCISYWRDTIKKEGKPYQPGYKLEVHVDPGDKNKPLQLSHLPQIQGSESIKVPQAIKNDCLSLEKFFVSTIQVRSLARLKDLERELRLTVVGRCEIKDLPVVLYIPLLVPCLGSEKLSVTVDMIRGCFLVSLAQRELPLTREIEECLNSDKKDLKKLLTNLRYWLMLERCRQSLQQMPVECYDELPFVKLSGHHLEAIGKHCLYVSLPMRLDYYLVVEVVMPVEKGQKKPSYNYYLLNVQTEGIETEAVASSSAADEGTSGGLRAIDGNDLPQLFLRPGQILKLDPFALTRGQCGKVVSFETEDSSHLSRKRKLLMGNQWDAGSAKSTKRSHEPTYFVSELTHIVALCEDKLSFVALNGELTKREISHTGDFVDGEGTSLALSLLNGLPCSGVSKKVEELLKSNLLSFTFRIQRKEKAIWCVENVFTNHPIKSTNTHEQGPEQQVIYHYDKLSMEPIEKTVNRLIADWNCVCRLFAAVVEFSEVYKDNAELQKSIEVRSYNYRHLVLGYGPQKCFTVTVQFSHAEQKFRLSFATVSPSAMSNCHTIVSTYLEKDLNSTKSLIHLSKILIRTCSVLMSICKLNSSPVTWLKINMVPMQMFTVLPVSSMHFRIMYRNLQCIDIQCISSFEVSVRDGSYSVFDTSRVNEGITPISGLQSFLSLFVDESNAANQARRRMTADDDNPLSPVVTDSMDSFLASSSNPPSVARNMIIAPSPSNMMAPSPGNPALLVPSSPSSFVPVPSPGSLGMHLQSPAAASFMPGSSGMVDSGGSPYPGSSGLVMPSPAARTWPGSPIVHASPASRMGMAPSPSHPSLQASPSQHKDVDHSNKMVGRMLPQRPWTTLVPSILSHDALDKLLTPVPTASSGRGIGGNLSCSPLEKFLGCTFLKRYMQRILSSDEGITNLPVSNEPGVLMFKFTCGLQCRLFMNPATFQSLCLKVLPIPDIPNQWDSEEISNLQKFFEYKVDCMPYKQNPLVAFTTIMKTPYHILKDLIQIMKMEMMPDRNFKWSVQWCLTLPTHLPNMAPVGSVAVTIINNRILFILQFTRTAAGINPQQPNDPQTITVPILYDITTNVTSTIDQKTMNHQVIMNFLKNCMDYHVKQNNECSILPCVREFATNFTV